MKTIKYMTGLLTFYLKGEISINRNFLNLKLPNTILALIPLGAKRDSVPVEQIASVSSNFKLNLIRFIVGIMFCLSAFQGFTDFTGPETAIAIIFLLLCGASIVITSFATEIRVHTAAGKEYRIPFLIFEKAKASQAEKLIRNMMANRLNDTNNRQVAEAQTNAIVDAIKNQKR